MDNSRDLAFNADLEKIEERDSVAHSTMSVSKRSGRTDHTGITFLQKQNLPDGPSQFDHGASASTFQSLHRTKSLLYYYSYTQSSSAD
jgi:hypothetical protein